MKSIVYITTNRVWSGSEELWSRSAKEMQKKFHKVIFAAGYQDSRLLEINSEYLLYRSRIAEKSILKKIIEHFSGNKLTEKNLLKEFINNARADLVIISQGNNIDSLEVMQCCQALHVSYVTLTQLVTEFHLLAINNDNLMPLQHSYRNAIKNYFVSQANMELNNRMLALNLTNSEVIYNPCIITEDEVPPYPTLSNFFHIGLVGRIECLHKGYDLLLQVASQEKWRQRPVQFNLYGSGPHEELLKTNIARMGIKNIFLKGSRSNVGEIWKENQILCLPSRMEGQALVLIEAMYCNRAAVVTNVGGAAELIEEGENGFIAPSPTVAELDAALERAWEMRTQWKEMGLKAGATIRQKHPEDAVAYFNHKILELLGA